MKRICAVLLVLLVMISAASAAEKGSWSFVQIADTQLGMSTGNKDLSVDVEHFRKAVAFINRTKPAFAVISGDLINIPHDPKQIRAFWQVARDVRPDVPLYLVAGNHDIGEVTEGNIRSYTRIFGKDYYSFSHKGTWFIVLDSNLIKDPKGAPALAAAQRRWFEEELATIRAKSPKRIFVLVHHPWFIESPGEKDQYFNIPQPQRGEYLDLMKRSGVEYTIAGHYHREASGQDGKLSMITTSAVSRALGDDPVGLRIFRVYPDRVEHRYYALEQLEEMK